MNIHSANLSYHRPRGVSTVGLMMICAAYFVLLNVSYTYVESTAGFKGILYSAPPTTYLIAGLGLALIPCLFLRSRLVRPSDVCLWILYLTVILPFMFLAHHIVDRPSMEIAFFQIYMVALFCFLTAYCRKGMRPPKRPAVSRHLLISSLVYSALLLLVAVVYTSGFHFNLSFEDIYDRRMDARDAVTIGSFRAYAITILGQAVAPILVAYGITRKSTTAVSVGLVSVVCIFSLNGTKASLFAPVFLLLLLAVIRRCRHQFAMALTAGTAGIVVLSMFLFLVLDNLSLSAYIVRRELIVPGVLLSYYWEFFSSHQHVWYSDGFLRWFIAPVYELPMARLIGNTYFGSDLSNANASLWAAAYGQAGYTGMFAITLIFGWILRLVDALSLEGDFEILAAMCGWYGLIWSNGALETSMLTNGFAVSLIFYLLPGPRSEDHPEGLAVASRFRGRPHAARLRPTVSR